MLNIDELILIYIILNYQINKRVTRVISCYTITNWVMFGYVIFNSFIIRIVFGLVNIPTLLNIVYFEIKGTFTNSIYMINYRL